MHMPKDSLQIVALLHVISVVISTNLRFYLFGKTAARTAISTYQGTSAYLRSVAVMLLWFSNKALCTYNSFTTLSQQGFKNLDYLSLRDFRNDI